jgi:hypothetical protein
VRIFGLLAAVVVFVFVGCSQPSARVQTRFNSDAKLKGQLPYDPFSWQVISSTLNENEHTVSLIVGNDRAVRHARTSAVDDYPAGSVICAITWSQQEDPRWFGGHIPHGVRSVEFLEVQSSPDPSRRYVYSMYTGSPLAKFTSSAQGLPNGRTGQLLMQRAAVMP